MSHFGVLSYKGTGHLNPLIALSRELFARGHRVTFFQTPDLETRVRQSGLEFSPIGSAARAGERHLYGIQRSALPGITALHNGLNRVIGDMEVSLREVPRALTRAGVDALIIDEVVLAGPTLAQMLHLPYFVISTSVPHSFGWSVPRSLSGCKSPLPPLFRLQKTVLEMSALKMRGPVRWKLDNYRRQVGLGPYRELKKVFPELAHIAQLPQCLDLPRATPPNNFCYAGPFIDEKARPFIRFPWDRLDGRPLVYASLGTTQKAAPGIFRVIAEACTGLDLQLVMSLGGRNNAQTLEKLPGSPLVVEDAPQLELIRRAELVITHGGLNTVLETLLQGKPMVAIPMAHDQPAVAARLSRLKVAEVLPIERISAASLRSMLTKVLNDPSYRNAAIEIQGKISSIQGLKIAADAIEQALERCARRQSAGAEVIHQSIPVGAESCGVSETQAVKATLDRRALIGQADR